MKLKSLINDCINIENNIQQIKIINDNLKKCKNSINSKLIIYMNDEEIHNFLQKIQNFGKFILDIKPFFEPSSIINNDINKQNSIIRWIKEKVNKKIVKFELIFKMSENGSKSEDFHKYCDDKGSTLILIKTNKNRIFGGFTPLSWKYIIGKKYYDESNQTFIFSLDLMKKYDMIDKKKQAIYCDINLGPEFGGNDFSLGKDMKKGETYANEYCNFLSNKNLELTGGNKERESFEVDELEVFRIIY